MRCLKIFFRFVLICIFIQMSTLQANDKFSQARRYEPVILNGSEVPQLKGVRPDLITAYRYNAAKKDWKQIAVQVDERKYMDLSVPPGKRKHPAAEYVYVGFSGGILGSMMARDDDPMFDENDEIVFMLEDAGDRAPKSIPGPSGDRSPGVEIQVSDPLSGAKAFVYLFRGKADPSLNGITYRLTDNREHSAVIETDYYRINYSRRWVLDQILIKPKLGGKGVDLIDRLKFRAYSLTPKPTKKLGNFNETEDYWSDGPGDCGFSSSGCSWYLGHKVGPVRAIRMVQGAASGPTTSYFAFFYRRMMTMKINYRVHAMPDIWCYMDYDADIGNARFYNSENSDIKIDGRQDRLRNSTGMWAQMSCDEGSIVTWLDLHNFQNLGRKTQITPYYIDDQGYNDLTGSDGKAIGNHGVRISNIPSTDRVNAVVAWYKIFLLPANTANIGQGFSDISKSPLRVHATLR